MKRRDLLTLALASSATACVLPVSKQAKVHNNAKAPTFAAHIWVYAKHQPNFDVSNILSRIWQDLDYAGLSAVELMEQPLRKSDKVTQISELIEEYQLPLLGTSYNGNFWDSTESEFIYDDLALILGNMQKLSARTLGISVGHPQNRKKTSDEFDAQAELLKRVQTLAKQHGVLINLHNHTYEVANDFYDLRNTLSRIPDIKLGPDLNWLIKAGINPVDFLKQYPEQIVLLHLRDQFTYGSWSESVGEGDTNFYAIGETLKQIDFSGDLVIELAHEDGFTPTRPIKESLKLSRLYLEDVLTSTYYE